MNEYLTVLALAALPAAGNFAGGLFAEFVSVSDRLLSLALHAAAGIVLGVVGIELMEQVLQAEPPWVPLLAFVAGGGAAVALDAGVDFVRGRFGGDEDASGEDASREDASGRQAAWMIYIGVAVDLFSDGILVGTGSTLSVSLGLLLALGQVPADVPEGFATIATFKRQGVPRWRRLLLAASFTVPILLAATLGYWTVRDAPDLYKLSLLAFTAGILLTVAVEEMVVQAHQTEDSRWDALMLVGGFALFALIAVYLG